MVLKGDLSHFIFNWDEIVKEFTNGDEILLDVLGNFSSFGQYLPTKQPLNQASL